MTPFLLAAALHTLFPEPGNVTVVTAIGVPYLALTEISVGIADRFSAGVIFAVADEIGVGFRPRAGLLEVGALQLQLAVPIVYYPPMSKRSGQDWVYANPQLRFDLLLPRGARVYAGAGLVLAACTDSIGAVLRGEKPEANERMVGGVWTTAHVGGSLRMTPTLDLTLDGGTVLNGRNVRAEYARRVGIPVLAELGFAKTF